MFRSLLAGRPARVVRSLNIRELFLVRSNAFARDESGSVVVTFAIVAVALLLMAGAALDFSRWGAERASMQTALDNTVMAAVKSKQTHTEYANAVFRANLLANTINENAAEAVSTLSCNSENSTFSCTASGHIPTTLIAAFTNIKKLPINVSAAANAPDPVAPSAVRFTVLQAGGWNWKKVTIWVHKVGAASHTAVGSVTYAPLVREGAYTLCQETGGSACIPCPIGQQCPEIELGTDYDYAYLSMENYEDGCDADSLDVNFHPESVPTIVNCVSKPGGLPNGKGGYVLYTNKEPEKILIAPGKPTQTVTGTPRHLFVDGVQVPLDREGKLMSIFDCKKDVTQAWEETLLGPMTSYFWRDQDFTFRVSTECASNSNFESGSGSQGSIRLTK